MKQVKQTKRAASWSIAYDAVGAIVTLTKTNGEVVTVSRDAMSEASAAMAWCYGVSKTAQNHASLPADEATGKVDQLAREHAAETFLRRIADGGAWAVERAGGARGPVWTLACKVLLRACEMAGEEGKREAIQTMSEENRQLLLSRTDHRLSPYFADARDEVIGELSEAASAALDAF